jgi:hypothetical protein
LSILLLVIFMERRNIVMTPDTALVISIARLVQPKPNLVLGVFVDALVSAVRVFDTRNIISRHPIPSSSRGD